MCTEQSELHLHQTRMAWPNVQWLSTDTASHGSFLKLWAQLGLSDLHMGLSSMSQHTLEIHIGCKEIQKADWGTEITLLQTWYILELSGSERPMRFSHRQVAGFHHVSVRQASTQWTKDEPSHQVTFNNLIPTESHRGMTYIIVHMSF